MLKRKSYGFGRFDRMRRRLPMALGFYRFERTRALLRDAKRAEQAAAAEGSVVPVDDAAQPRREGVAPMPIEG